MDEPYLYNYLDPIARVWQGDFSAYPEQRRKSGKAKAQKTGYQKEGIFTCIDRKQKPKK